MRYFIVFAYNGSRYFGFQKQPNAVTVQETLEKAMGLLLHEEIKITGAGRTDTGVHARKMFAHFDLGKPLTLDLTHRLNRFLPPDISIFKVVPVSEDLHARFSAVARTYQYRISLIKDPFTENSAWQHWRKPLNIDRMNEACKILFEYEDFTSFAKLHSDNKTNLCTITEAFWIQKDQELIFTITANRFLRNMVRAIVGTLVEIGSGKYPPSELHKIIEKQNRSQAGTSAPAHGLYLTNVQYPVEI